MFLFYPLHLLWLSLSQPTGTKAMKAYLPRLQFSTHLVRQTKLLWCQAIVSEDVRQGEHEQREGRRGKVWTEPQWPLQRFAWIALDKLSYRLYHFPVEHYYHVPFFLSTLKPHHNVNASTIKGTASS